MNTLPLTIIYLFLPSLLIVLLLVYANVTCKPPPSIYSSTYLSIHHVSVQHPAYSHSALVSRLSSSSWHHEITFYAEYISYLLIDMLLP